VARGSILVCGPQLQVLVLTSEKGQNGVPALPEIHCCCKQKDFEYGIAGIDTYIWVSMQSDASAPGISDHGQRAPPEVHFGVSSACKQSMSMCAHLQVPDSNVRLCPVHSIESLVQKESNCPSRIDPSRHILVEARVVPEKGEEIQDDESEARKRDLCAYSA